ncbi:NlpC/P60 family protein [Planifilum fulgidum]|jgi:cell wall-associated NlpC family hydrolase|uniref:NlpC/P60 family protein n=1 Tax=Planifilum fulgidum TaxID=201973 RepID=A0A1I2N9X2_9BACL|nr:C40 family peptidase [Planifilum fulgidum]SFF98517.1 NlpC/P60 family protein [Planifilum fulgidum]
MQFFKRFRKVLWMGALTLVVSAFIPGGTSYAAASKSAHDLIQSIFNRVGLKYEVPKAKPETPSKGEGVNPAPAPAPTPPQQEESKQQQPVKPEQPETSTLADRIIKTGEKYLGTPYKYGASSNQTNYFDCSSFVQRVFKENGINLPRSSRQQAKVGTYVPKNQIQKGDLLFFTTSYSPNQIAHVGIYAGNNKILHTWGPGGVRYDDLNGMKWLREGYVTARRVIK